MVLNRKERRALQAEQHKHVEALPDRLTLVPREDYPRMERLPDQVWRSRKFLVQVYAEDNPAFPGLVRLSICRVKIKVDGSWKDEIAWEDLMQIKRECGFGDRQAVEIYPPDQDVVNVANMRHLWVFAVPIPVGWTRR